jgi:hypothetical protein
MPWRVTQHTPQSLNVSVGSKTEVTALKSDFRCYPNNGHRATTTACPFRANGRRRSLAADAFDGSVLAQDRHVGRFGGFQSLTRVGGQGDGYQKLIAVIVAVCGHRL